ncbi:MAG: hypothetical protein QM758_06565 [Armatimonas sp.]
MNDTKWLFLLLTLKALRPLGLHRSRLGRTLRRRLIEVYPVSRGGDLWRAVYCGKREGATEAEKQAGKEALEQLRQRYPASSEEMFQRLE